MKPRIYKTDNECEFYFQEGCFILEVANSEDRPDISIVRARVEPGVTTRRHRLSGITERYVVCEGQGTVEVGDLDPVEVDPHDVVEIPPMCAQRITNTGAGDLVFLAICTPRFVAQAYEDVEQELGD